MKKKYMKPAMRVVVMPHKYHILSASNEVRGVKSNFEDEEDNFLWGGGSSNNAR